jgi:TusE/DsrC/DsvC family sulfur relay protein
MPPRIHEPHLNAGQFDADGFIKNPRQWNEDLAELIAEADGIGELTAEHWRVIHYLREHYLKFHAMPIMRHVCGVTHLEKHCVTDLFGNDSKKAWRIAGLPNPGEEAKAYM